MTSTNSSKTTQDPQSMSEKVDAFLIDNPNFLRLFAGFARQFRDATGTSRIGCQMVIERVRWERNIQTKSNDFKVNNSFEPYLSRLVMHEFPDLDGLFVTRKADDADEWLARRIADAESYELFTIPAPRQGRS